MCGDSFYPVKEMYEMASIHQVTDCTFHHQFHKIYQVEDMYLSVVPHVFCEILYTY